MNTQPARYKIGEFSKLAQVSPHMLRHYDKLGLLQPSQVDRLMDYRYGMVHPSFTIRAWFTCRGMDA